MINVIFNDFRPYMLSSKDAVLKYRDVIPKELALIWMEYGFGSFRNGYFKIINPDEYRRIVDNTYYAANESIPIMVTGFGDIITFQKEKCLGVIKYRKKTACILPVDFKDLFEYLHEDLIQESLEYEDYDEIVKTNGYIKYGECYGCVPALEINGLEMPGYLKRMGIKVYIDIIIQMLGYIK